MRQTWLGVIPATKKKFHMYLEAGDSCIIVSGGVREMIHIDYETEVTILASMPSFLYGVLFLLVDPRSAYTD